MSLYPVPVTDDDTEAKLAPYRSGKGTLKFELDEPLPYELIERVIALLTEQR